MIIEHLNHKAEGVSDAKTAIRRVLPGEVLDDQCRILTPSTDRVRPPCRHYKSCGGCALQHASDDFVAGWKTDVIREGLAARGIKTEIRPIATSPTRSRRRATLHGRRTKSGALVGFFAPGSDVLTAIPDCQVLDPRIVAALRMLEELTSFAASRKSIVHFDVTVSETGLDIAVRGGKDMDAMAEAEAAQFARQHRLARLSWDGEVIAARHPATQHFGPAKVEPPPGAFLQATDHGQSTLWTSIAESLQGYKRVVDLFAGCGTFTLPAAQVSEIWALEGDDDLVSTLDTGWRNTADLKRVTAEVRDLFRRPLLPQEFAKFDAVIIDPPRAGAEAQHQELAKSDIARIAAVSCNPVTFSRDAELLISGGYTLDWVQPVDQFRWSSHVELAAQFTKGHMASK